MRKDDVWSWPWESDRPADKPSCEGSDVPCLFLQKVHQPQVPGLRCHCQQGECQKSFWSFNDWAQWQLPDMAFKCLTSIMIEEWITDAYCIMSLLNHIVPYVWQVTARWSTGKSCQRVPVWRAWSHDQKALWHASWDWSFTDLTTVQNRSMCSAVKYSQGQLLRDVWGWTRHKKEQKRKSWRWNGVPDELSRSGVLEETQHVFNATLILRCAIQSLQPSTPFPAEPADLSEEKINVHVPSELYNFLSWIMTGKVQGMALLVWTRESS